MDNLDDQESTPFWMNAQTPAALLEAATIIRTPAHRSEHQLVIRQNPEAGKVFVGKEKDRKPIDPPPIIQLQISKSLDPNQNYLQSPYYFISCSLLDDDETRSESEREDIQSALAGTLVSSLHRLKDTDNVDGGFFVFGDLSVKMEGTFRLQFTLYEVHGKEVELIKSIESDHFNIYASKNWPGMSESTFLTRSFSDQGVRLRLRKEPRFRLGARGPSTDDYQPRHYNKTSVQSRRDSQIDFSQQSSPVLHSQQGYIPTPRNMQIEYQVSAQNPQMHLQGDSIPDVARKRDHSRSHPHSGSLSSHEGFAPMEEPPSKRARSEASTHSDHSVHGGAYSLQSPPQYGNRMYQEPSNVPSYASFGHTIHQPQPPYGSYVSSPRSGSGQMSPQYQQYQNFSPPSQQHPYVQQQSQQMLHGYPSAQQYVAQLQQPIPQNRAAANSLTSMDMYSNVGSQQIALPQIGTNFSPRRQEGSFLNPANLYDSRPQIHQYQRSPSVSISASSIPYSAEPRLGVVGMTEMPPPMFGGGPGRGIGQGPLG